jgi:hypothetical protein
MAVLLVWFCRGMKCVLQNSASASVCEYMKDVEPHTISVCYSDTRMCRKPVHFKSYLVKGTLSFLSFNSTKKKWPGSSSWV